MKGPMRPAPAVPGFGVTRYSPATNWNDDPFGDVFEPTPHPQKKKPPPRPPPPKVNFKMLDIPVKPPHFVRKPTVLSSLLSRNKSNTNTVTNQCASNQQNHFTDFNSDLDTNKMFPKCEPKNVQTGALIDLSSPPSSPTFTTRSSSDGLSVDSFGSDGTTSTSHLNVLNGGNASQAESGFEDDFDLFLSSRKRVFKEESYEDFTTVDPFSPQLASNKLSSVKKSAISKDLLDTSTVIHQPVVSLLKGPTIIRAKPARPKPPDNSALLKSTFGNSLPVTSMTVNTTTPIQKIGNIANSFGDNFDTKPNSWEGDSESLSERESSPPMPSIPPPPPPEVIDDDLPITWHADEMGDFVDTSEEEEPFAVALFDYFTSHPDDLCFSANSRINLVRRVDNEWLYGRLRSGAEGLFPANYVEIKVPLPSESVFTPAPLGIAIAVYDFEPVQDGDLRFKVGDSISVVHKINDEWYFGECNGRKGQFPFNYVQMN